VFCFAGDLIDSHVLLTAFLTLVPYTSLLRMTQDFITMLCDLHHIAWAGDATHE